MALQDNIVAYWKMNGHSKDAFGAYNGTDSGVSYGSASGKVGDGASFNGSASISLGGDLLNGATSGTIAGWIKRSVTGSQHTIIDKTQTGFKNYIQFIVEGSGGNADKLRLIVNNSAGIFSTGTIDTNWHHVAVTWNGSNVKFYIDGSLDSTQAFTYTVPSTSRTLYIGKVDNNSAYMNGYIDELGIWNRALSLSEIQSLYNSGNGISLGNFDNSSGKVSPAPTTTETFSHTCSGSDRLLVVQTASDAGQTSSVTYNGVALTKIADIAHSGYGYVGLWYLVNPPAGTYNIVVSGAGSTYYVCNASSWMDMDQSSPVDVFTSNNGTASVFSSTLTTTVDKDIHVMGIRFSGASLTNGSNTYMRSNAGGNGAIADGGKQISPAGSNTLTLNGSSSLAYGLVGATFKIKNSIVEILNPEILLNFLT